MIKTQLLMGLSGVIAALVMAHPAVARACSCAPVAISQATPSDGATDVPIDIAPIIRGNFQEGTVTLKRESGDSVDFELRASNGLGHCGGRTGELTLKADLEPNTRYVLRAQASDSTDFATNEITFTTGSDRVPDEALSAPTLRATFLRGNPIGDSCASSVQGCIGTDDDGAQIELTFVSNEDAQRVAILEGDTQVTVRVVPDCVEARTRDAAGRRSAATVLCGKELNARDATEADYRDFQLDCDDGAIRESVAPPDGGMPPSVSAPDGGRENEAEKTGSSASCSVDAQRGSHSWLALLSMLAATFAARRKRVIYASARERC